MKEIPSKIDILIIGAGPSGLACALECQRRGKSFLLLDKSNRVGGRVGSIKEDGFIFDLGFQVYNTAYEVTNSLLNKNNLVLNHFQPGAMIHDGNSFQIISDPMRDISQVFTTLFSNISTMGDKVKILKLKNLLRGYKIHKDNKTDIETNQFLLDFGFSNRIIEMFFRPFFSGIFLEKKLKTSSKFFKYVFSTFNIGLASLPDNGMQSIPENLLNSIDKKRVLLKKKMIKIDYGKHIFFEDGSSLTANNLVLTGESSSLVNGLALDYNPVKTLYFSSKIEPQKGKYIHLFPCDDIINNIAIPTSISPTYSDDGSHLFSVTIIGNKTSELELVNKVQSRLKKYYGGEKDDYQFLKYFKINKGTLVQLPGHFKREKSSTNSIILSGEHQTNGSIEGAVLSGIEAVNYI